MTTLPILSIRIGLLYLSFKKYNLKYVLRQLLVQFAALPSATSRQSEQVNKSKVQRQGKQARGYQTMIDLNTGNKGWITVNRRPGQSLHLQFIIYEKDGTQWGRYQLWAGSADGKVQL